MAQTGDGTCAFSADRVASTRHGQTSARRPTKVFVAIVALIRSISFATFVCWSLSSCSGTPLIRYSQEGPPLILLPAEQAGVSDRRARFREIYCAVLEARHNLPDYRPCEDALTRVGEEPPAGGRPVELGTSK